MDDSAIQNISVFRGTEPEAVIVQVCLEDHGIKAELDGALIATVAPHTLRTGAASVNVLVSDVDAAAARNLIAERGGSGHIPIEDQD